MFKNKVLLTLLFLITLSLSGCIVLFEYYLVLNNELVKKGDVEIVLDNDKKILLEIMRIYRMSISSRFIKTRLKLVRKPEDIEIQYNRGKGHFIIRDGENTIIGIPKLAILEKDGNKTYLISPSSHYIVPRSSPELYGMTFELGRMPPQVFSL